MSQPDVDPVALAFEDVSVVRGGRLIWSDATFTVPAGGIVAVIGPNGAGKTTLLQVILGLLPVASGHVEVFGKRPGEDNHSIGYVPQNYVSVSDEAIRGTDAVMLGLNGHKWAFASATTAQRRRVAQALESMYATQFAGRRLSRLSGGQRQRVAIAQALVSGPKILILDEPLASLDLRSQREIVKLLPRLQQDLGVTILVVAHDLNPLLNVVDSAVYLLEGRAHYAPMDRVVDDGLLSELYGTEIEVARTPRGELYMRSVL